LRISDHQSEPSGLLRIAAPVSFAMDIMGRWMSEFKEAYPLVDLELLFEEGDIQQREMGLSYLNRVLGQDEALLKSMSPVNYVEKINAGILLAHGEEDKRAPFEHAEKLSAALDKANKPYEWFAIDKEAHGFFNPENQKAYMRKVVKFLDQHIN